MDNNIVELVKSQARQSEVLEHLTSSVDEIRLHLIGKPNGRPGLLTRVDRLEMTDRIKNKIIWLIGGSVVGGILSWVLK